MILAAAFVPFLVGGVGARVARRVATGLPPVAAVALLTTLAASVAAGCAVVLLLAGLLALAEVPTAALGHVSVDALRDHVPMPPAVGFAAAAIALLMVLSVLWHALRLATRAGSIDAATARLGPAVDNLVIVRDPGALAYAVPGRTPRIVVSTGMLRALSAPERRALLAHEAAHLRYHHQCYVRLGQLAASANPLLRPVCRAIELAVERWADEIAAREVGDRVLVAHAVAAAALAHRPAPRGALAAAGANVLDRVRVLLTPKPRRQPVAAALSAVGAAACWVAALLLADHLDELLELAHRISSGG